jgi:RNA polymerase sigma-70 factor, ECF subfamily
MQPTPSADTEQVTALLIAASGGNVEALNQLFPLVYDELRRLARQRLRAERGDHTLSTTALVHEAYLRLVGQTQVQWQSRAHFLAVASTAMRRILINYAEMRKAGKRGGGALHVALEGIGVVFTEDQADELLALDQALDRLKAFNPRGADVITYRFFGGLTHEEIAGVMGTSTITVRRAWSTAKSWLRRELREAMPGWEGGGLGAGGQARN